MTKVVVASPRTIPNGVYSGFWSGYHVEFAVEGLEYEGRSEHGVKGIQVPCQVTVTATAEGSDITVEAV